MNDLPGTANCISYKHRRCCRHIGIHRDKNTFRLQSTHLSRRRWSLRYSTNWF